MNSMDTAAKMRVYIMDSLVSKSGQVLNPSLISELTAEILERMLEIFSEGCSHGQKINRL